MACGAASDHAPAGERREDTGGGAAATGGTAGVEEAVSGGSQVSEARACDKLRAGSGAPGLNGPPAC
jgi:hypothetical protein